MGDAVDKARPGADTELKNLLRPDSIWHWLAYALCLAMLAWIVCHATHAGILEGDDINIAMGVNKAVNGLAPLQHSYRFHTAPAMYYPLYFIASLGVDPLAGFYYLSVASAGLFVLAFSLFGARFTGCHFSFCLLALLSLQEVIASFIYANDMAIGMMVVSCGLAIQIYRPRFWLVTTAICAALAAGVRIDLARFVMVNVLLVHLQPGAGLDRHLKLLKTDAALCGLTLLFYLLLMLGSGADIKAGFLFLASAHAKIYFDNYYHFSYVTMESLRSMLGYWLAPACLGLLLMAWDRKLYQSLLICGFCLVGILFVLPLDTCPKYLLPHLAIASLGAAYALNRLLSGEKGMRVLGAALGATCLLAPLLVTPVFHEPALGPCSLQYGQLARIGDLRLLSIGTGRVLGTHDGSRLGSGYLFLPPMVDLIKKNYSRIKKEIGRHIETSGSRACFGNSANWLARALIMYELTNRGYRPREPGVWTQPGRDEVVILKELINTPPMAALCPDKDTYYVDHRELTGHGT